MVPAPPPSCRQSLIIRPVQRVVTGQSKVEQWKVDGERGTAVHESGFVVRDITSFANVA